MTKGSTNNHFKELDIVVVVCGILYKKSKLYIIIEEKITYGKF